MRRRYGYFNPEPPETVFVPTPPAAAPRASVAKVGKKVRRFGKDLVTVNQILGGMVGFVGTNVVSGAIEHYLPYQQWVSRIISGGIVYGAAWFLVGRTGGMAANKAELRKAVLFGIILNVALSFFTAGLTELKSATGIGAYLNQTPSPQDLHPGEVYDQTQEYSYN